MSSAKANSVLRSLLASCLAFVMLFMPIADAEHTQDTPVEACEVTHSDDEQLKVSQNGSKPEHHDHHAHNCGTCHIHLVFRDLTYTPLLKQISIDLKAGAARSLALGAPDTHYRPPRSFN